MGFGVHFLSGYEEKFCGIGISFMGAFACTVRLGMLVGYIYELHGVMSISISRVHYGGSVSVYEGERKGWVRVDVTKLDCHRFRLR